MSLFKKRNKPTQEEILRRKIDHEIIAKLAIEIVQGPYGYVRKTEIIKGKITNVADKAIQINNEWYILGYEIKGIYNYRLIENKEI